jgi:hypothetical protein
MAHFPKPFFRTSRGLWYVQLDGRQVNLGAEKAEAFKAYHHLMQHRSEPDPAPRALTQRQVIVLVDGPPRARWSPRASATRAGPTCASS